MNGSGGDGSATKNIDGRPADGAADGVAAAGPDASPASRRVLLGPADLADGEMRGYETDGGRLVLLGRIDGRYRAIDDWCNHAGCQISMGWLDRKQGGGFMAVCPCHEIGFDMETGRNVTSPDICGDQPAFEVTVAGGEVFVDLPEES